MHCILRKLGNQSIIFVAICVACLIGSGCREAVYCDLQDVPINRPATIYRIDDISASVRTVRNLIFL